MHPQSRSDFLLYLLQDRKHQPSAIDGYRSTIADKLGNLTIIVSKVENPLLEPFPGATPTDKGSL